MAAIAAETFRWGFSEWNTSHTHWSVFCGLFMYYEFD